MGAYIDAANLYNYFGQPNVDKWANIPTAGAATAEGRIAAAIASAEAEIEVMFTDSRYEVPFSVTGSDLIVLQGWMVVYAVWWLRTPRGIDADKKDHVLELKKEVDKVIQAVLTGIRKFSTGEYDDTVPTGPADVEM